MSSLLPVNFEHLHGLVWTLAFLVPLLFLQRGVQRELQGLFLLATRRADLSIVLFSLVLFPGVLLHEGSHFLVARLLGVKTGRFSILPRPLSNGKLQLGFVETATTDWFRDALIGVAPLLAGGALVTWIGLGLLDLDSLFRNVLEQGSPALVSSLNSLIHLPDFWLWFYILMSVSSTMMPSSSDRRAWLPVILIVLFIIAIGVAAGLGPWFLQHLSIPFNRIMYSVAAVFAISATVHLILFGPLYLCRRLLERLTGMVVQ